ncbi:MAG TPA: TlpA disulfide reductase family protein [Caulobacteraceae bacterium]|jgi:thiol-disulfide isomerase/thioredoxin|nr:TlpA disulfide reductase family protein [Caulobacteraceae bacterium]
MMGRVSKPGAACAVGVAVALLYALAGCSSKPGDLEPLVHGAMAKLVPTAAPGPPPATVFHDAAGAAHTLADFKGKVVVLNLWANWCAPCKEEIPSLAKLETEFAGKDLAVIPVSLGQGKDESLGHAFLSKYPPLPFYTEPTDGLPFAFHPVVEAMPTTILYDRHGVEKARLAGGADWSGPDARRVIQSLLDEK